MRKVILAVPRLCMNVAMLASLLVLGACTGMATGASQQYMLVGPQRSWVSHDSAIFKNHKPVYGFAWKAPERGSGLGAVVAVGFLPATLESASDFMAKGCVKQSAPLISRDKNDDAYGSVLFSYSCDSSSDKAPGFHLARYVRHPFGAATVDRIWMHRPDPQAIEEWSAYLQKVDLVPATKQRAATVCANNAYWCFTF